MQRPGAGPGPPLAEDEIGVSLDDRIRDGWQRPRIERAVAVHEADDVPGRHRKAGEAGGAEAGTRLVDDPSPSFRATAPEPSVEPLSATIGTIVPPCCRGWCALDAGGGI